MAPATEDGHGKVAFSKFGQVVHGDPEFDGRIIIYVIKGAHTSLLILRES